MGERQDVEMKDKRSIEERILDGKEDYRKIPVPDQMKAKLEEGIMRAEAGKRKKKKIVRLRIAATVAAAAAVLIILPNTGAGVAHAMGSLPVVGKLFQAVTFRDYQYESDRFDANVEVPHIVVGDVSEEGTKAAGEDAEKNAAETQNKEEAPDKLQETVDQINFDIEEVTNRLIEEFQASADLGESYGSLEIHHEIVTDNERYFTLKLSLYQGAGSGYESYKYYTIDKQTGEQIRFGDLFREGSNYNEMLSENIREQMRARMAEDENSIYWVDYEEVPEWNWQRLKEDQNFYFDKDGNLVFSFDEYEVAPGYMGAPEFTVERAVFEDILK